MNIDTTQQIQKNNNKNDDGDHEPMEHEYMEVYEDSSEHHEESNLAGPSSQHHEEV